MKILTCPKTVATGLSLSSRRRFTFHPEACISSGIDRLLVVYCNKGIVCTVYQEFTFKFEETEGSLVKLTVCRHLQAETGGNGGQGANASTESQDTVLCELNAGE